MSRIIREARPTDMAEIMKVMDAAKGIMRQSGNTNQSPDLQRCKPGLFGLYMEWLLSHEVLDYSG